MILLPVNEDTPRLIDVVSEKKYDEVIDSTWYECKMEHLYPKTSFLRDLPIQTIGINGPTLEGDRCISMIYDDKSLINGSPVNRCVQRLTNGRPTLSLLAQNSRHPQGRLNTDGQETWWSFACIPTSLSPRSTEACAYSYSTARALRTRR